MSLLGCILVAAGAYVLVLPFVIMVVVRLLDRARRETRVVR